MTQRINRYKLCDLRFHPYLERVIERLPEEVKEIVLNDMSFQIPRPFCSATVRENVAVGAMFGSLADKVSVDDSLDLADRYVGLVGLESLKNKESGSLTPVEKKMMEIARALAMKPKLLLVDEAMAGMHPKNIDAMVRFLKKTRKHSSRFNGRTYYESRCGIRR